MSEFDTKEIGDIKIEDPLNFLTAAEKEAYIRQQDEVRMRAKREELLRTQELQRLEEERLRKERRRSEALQHRRAEQLAQIPEEERRRMKADTDDPLGERKTAARRTSAPSGQRRKQSASSGQRRSGAPSAQRQRSNAGQRTAARPRSERYDDAYEEAADPVERLVRIASVITGTLILLVLLFIGGSYVRTYLSDRAEDDQIAADADGEAEEDEAATVAAPEIEGFTAMNDTVVTTNDLRLRTTPDSSVDHNIETTVRQGTRLSRTGINESIGWSRVDYQGKTLYCANRYLSAPSD